MRDNRKILVGVFMICFAFVSFSYILGSLIYAETLKVKPRDRFCPLNTWAQQWKGIAIPGHTIILVDTSNKISKKDGTMAFAKIEEWLRDSEFLQKISVYGLPKGEYEKPNKLGHSWCIPKQGKNADPLFSNLRKAEITFKAKFLGRIKKIFNVLIQQKEAPQSPIVETLAYFSNLDDKIKVNSVWLISDMLQHSSLASDYAGTGDMQNLCKKLKFDSVKIYSIGRNIPQQSSAHQEKWEKCFAVNSATIEWL